jgi:diguanylate cyclase (GGDEF)-like protein
MSGSRPPDGGPVRAAVASHIRPGTGRHAAYGRGRTVWVPWLAVSVVAVIGYLAVEDGHWYTNLYYDIFGLLAAAMIVVGVRLHRPARPVIWYCFAAGQALWVVGDFMFGYFEHVLDVAPFPSLADVLYLGGYPVLVAGLAILIRGRASGRDRAGLVDAGIIAAGVGLLAWEFWIRPIVLDESLSPAAWLISLGYPMMDLLMFVMVARLFTTAGARTPSFRLLAGAIMLVLVADVVYADLNVPDLSYAGGWVDSGWLLSYALWAAAALHPSMRSLSEVAYDRAPRMSGGRLAVLVAVALLAPGLLVVQGASDPAAVDWAGIAVGWLLLCLLVLIRMHGLVAQVREQAGQLAELAHNDALTGMPNRRAWELELAREMAIARRTGMPLSVSVLDLDHFKQYNDEYGHQAGDHLLTAAAARWKSHLREQDYIARYGGEEFCVMITGSPAARAVPVLERLLTATPEGQTFSAGVATWDGAETAESLVARADAALYHAKRSGRARVIVATVGLGYHEVVEPPTSGEVAPAAPPLAGPGNPVPAPRSPAGPYQPDLPAPLPHHGAAVVETTP